MTGNHALTTHALRGIAQRMFIPLSMYSLRELQKVIPPVEDINIDLIFRRLFQKEYIFKPKHKGSIICDK
jgi:hypothetical protein